MVISSTDVSFSVSRVVSLSRSISSSVDAGDNVEVIIPGIGSSAVLKLNPVSALPDEIN